MNSMRSLGFPSVSTGVKGTLRRGFTLTELLIVMLIIMILMALLLPVISKVRNAAYQSSTQQEIDRLAAGIQQYFSDFQTYPGLFKNDDLGTANMPTIQNVSNSQNITETENMELSCFGGIIWNGTALDFDLGTLKTSKGAVSLNSSTNSKTYPAYLTAGSNEWLTTNINSAPSNGMWNPTPAPPALAGASQPTIPPDSEIPELGDPYPSPMPIVYLRARVGSPGCVYPDASPDDASPPTPAVTAATGAQYNATHLYPYFNTGYVMHYNPSSAASYFAAGAGGQSVFATGWSGYFANASAPQVGGQYVPKNANGFFLIAAGSDRAFGTRDDVIYGFQY